MPGLHSIEKQFLDAEEEARRAEEALKLTQGEGIVPGAVLLHQVRPVSRQSAFDDRLQSLRLVLLPVLPGTHGTADKRGQTSAALEVLTPAAHRVLPDVPIDVVFNGLLLERG